MRQTNVLTIWVLLAISAVLLLAIELATHFIGWMNGDTIGVATGLMGLFGIIGVLATLAGPAIRLVRWFHVFKGPV